MAFELQDGQLFVFNNQHKRNPAQPDRQGQMKIGGVEYRVACWLKEGKNGKFLSCKVQTEEEAQQYASNSQSQPQPSDFDDDIPF